ncbi:MAG: hypothetical protein WAZ50_01275, partial [Minisyncoccia bacterium]
TSFFATTGTFTNLFGSTLNLTNLLVTGSTTLQNFTFNNATGSAATTTNLYFSNNLTGPGNFIVNSSGNVGVGTMSPTSKLDVNGLITTTGSASGGIQFGTTGQGQIYRDGVTGDLYIVPQNNKNILLNTGGNIGIGTLTPNFKLEVNGTASTTNFFASYATTTNSTSTSLFSTTGTFTNLFANTLNLTNLLVTGSTTLQDFTFRYATGTAATTTNLYTSGQTILAGVSGNVGIGTTTPSRLLTVEGTGTGQVYSLFTKGNTVSSISSTGLVNINTKVTDDSVLTNARGLTVWMEPGVGANVSRSFRGIEGDAVIAAGDTSTYTNANSVLGLLFQALYRGDAPGSAVGATGLITIAGTQTGNGNLTNAKGVYTQISVAGTGTITNGYGIFVDNPIAGGTLQNNYGLYIENQTTGSNNYSIYSNGGKNYFAGNVGIGTTTPAQPLQVNGTNGIGVGPNGGAVYPVLRRDNVTGGLKFSQYTGATDSYSDKIFMDASGNFGIGITPNYKLEVNGTASTTNFFAFYATTTNSTSTTLFTSILTANNATTTNFFTTTGSSTNLFATNGNIGTLTTGPITSGLINGQTISSGANFT